ncbi:MAG TPA: CsbD family protein [Candidatus Acidoferrum sp.]|nr:CsbD family protein [Candidatus Acidoferrum sp.]
MNTLELKGNWNVVKGKLKKKWASLTDDDLKYVEGQEAELVGRIQKRTGQSKEAVERALREDSATAE